MPIMIFKYATYAAGVTIKTIIAMKKQEYQELVDKAMTLIADSIRDNELRDTFWGWEKMFRMLPKQRETIRTLKGIVGFHEYCTEKNDMGPFLFNAVHDIVECCKNYTEPWFSPRLGRFAK